jgi:hypothetical protein
MKEKAVLHGNWIYDRNDGWHLAVYPIVTIMPRPGEPPLYSSFVLVQSEVLNTIGTPTDAIERMFSSTAPPVSNMTLYNLGVVEDEHSCEELDLFLVCPTADMSHSPTHSCIVQEGYMYVEDLGIDDTDEQLDWQIYQALQRLEAPHILTCSPKV